LLAPLASPVFSGTPKIGANNITTDNELAGLATQAALTTEVNRAEAAEALLAPLASPVFSGTPKIGANNISTDNELAALAPLASPVFTGTPKIGANNITTDNELTALAPLASPVFTGTPKVGAANILTAAAISWTALTLINGWTTPINATAARITLDQLGFVHIEGTIQNPSSVNTPPFVIPAGFRPSAAITLMLVGLGSAVTNEVIPFNISTAGVISGLGFVNANTSYSVYFTYAP
jgi:hypothetical protein